MVDRYSSGWEVVPCSGPDLFVRVALVVAVVVVVVVRTIQ